jgi:hypothetical protein
MKIYVSYVVQDSKGHQHGSKCIDVMSPPIAYSTLLPVAEVMDWAAKVQSEMNNGKKIIITSIYKA